MELDFWDILLLVLSLLVSAAIGLYFTNKNKNLDAYMLGDRRLSVLPVAVSLMTSCMSALSLLGSSAELYYQGPSFSFIVVPLMLAGPLTAFTILPVFYRMNELSLYKYLELRYHPAVRSLVSIVFMLQFIFFNAVVLYLPAVGLQSVLGVSKYYSILLIGILCVLYSGVGGLKAVVWTDFFQAMLMYTAVLIVAVLGTYDAGGLGSVLQTAGATKRLDLTGFLSLDVTTRHTLLGMLVGLTLKQTYMLGVNQVQIQRALSLPSLRQGQLAFVLCGLFAAAISLISSYTGLVINSAYAGCDPYLAGQVERRDAVAIHYVSVRLRKLAGLRGVFVAGIFSATLSTLSSFSNSMSALALEDIVRPLMGALCAGRQLAPRAATRLAKLLATCFGLICVLMAFVIDKANSRLLQATTTMTGAVGVPFMTAFGLGIFTRFTNSWGVLAAFLVALPFGVYLAIYQVFFSPALEPQMPIYYESELCPLVLNMSLDPATLAPLSDRVDFAKFGPPAEPEPFKVLNLSYVMLPLVQALITVLVASVVSLLTGGRSQEVKDEYLVAWLHRRPAEEPAELELAGKHTGGDVRSIQLERAFDSVSQRKRKPGVVVNGEQ